MWTYRQQTGEFFDAEGELVETGYSGFGEGKNNPDREDEHDVGPIPRGVYTIGATEFVDTSGPHGPFVLPLTPDQSNEMFGRDSFLIHGDSVSHPGAASHGCIILSRVTREAIAASDDDELTVE